MPRGARRDFAVTKLLRDEGVFEDSRSFISHPLISDGLPHLFLYGIDAGKQRQRVYNRDSGRCQLRIASSCPGYVPMFDAEMDHIMSGLVGRTWEMSNLRMVCQACHRKRHNREIKNPKG